MQDDVFTVVSLKTARLCVYRALATTRRANMLAICVQGMHLSPLHEGHCQTNMFMLGNFVVFRCGVSQRICQYTGSRLRGELEIYEVSS